MMDMMILIKGRDLDVNFEVEDITLGKNGIGWYEFWGARCYDAGVTYVDDFTVTAVTVYSERRDSYVAPSPQLLTAITEAIYDDEGIRADLLERAEAEAEAARDAYHESNLDAMRGADQSKRQLRFSWGEHSTPLCCSAHSEDGTAL